MVERRNKPTALAATPGLPPQPQVDFSDDNSRVSAVLPTGESVQVLLYGATVTSWKDSAGNEKLWLSDAAALDGSAPVRGGIPLVFPVFGQDPNHSPTSKLPSHGFARRSRWEFLGKSTSESAPLASGSRDDAVKLDFGLSSPTLDEATKQLWPHAFSLIYSVTLSPDGLTTSIVITNDGDSVFDYQVLLHTYLKINDISKTQIAGLDNYSYLDKVAGSSETQSGNVTIAGEVDRVYGRISSDSDGPVEVQEGDQKLFRITRDSLKDVVVWNPWSNKAASIGDFEPKDGYKTMVCVEVGSVKEWQKLEPGESYEGGQTISY